MHVHSLTAFLKYVIYQILTAPNVKEIQNICCFSNHYNKIILTFIVENFIIVSLGLHPASILRLTGNKTRKWR